MGGATSGGGRWRKRFRGGVGSDLRLKGQQKGTMDTGDNKKLNNYEYHYKGHTVTFVCENDYKAEVQVWHSRGKACNEWWILFRVEPDRLVVIHENRW
jgi:hypothetical protein